jgi:hypothetical protein
MSCCGRVRCTPGATHATGRLINKTTGPLALFFFPRPGFRSIPPNLPYEPRTLEPVLFFPRGTALSHLRAVGPEGTHERTRARSSNCTTAGRDSRPLPRGCVLSSEGGGAAQSWVSSSWRTRPFQLWCSLIHILASSNQSNLAGQSFTFTVVRVYYSVDRSTLLIQP